LAKRLSKITGLKYFDLNGYIRENELYDSYDKADKTFDVDVKRLRPLNSMFRKRSGRERLFDKMKGSTLSLKDFINIVKDRKLNGVIIDSHLSQNMNSDYCIIVKSDIKDINKRLTKRGYAKKKIKDNVESEIFDVCLEEAKNLKRRIIIVIN
jgi:broad-specificity NMP kinase